MSNVREIANNFRALIADGLEETARQIRAGNIDARRAFVVMTVKGDGEDQVGGQMFGAVASTAEIVGMLQLAQHQVIEQG